MVVLTFLLAKAAYNRYISNNRETGEVVRQRNTGQHRTSFALSRGATDRKHISSEVRNNSSKEPRRVSSTSSRSGRSIRRRSRESNRNYYRSRIQDSIAMEFPETHPTKLGHYMVDAKNQFLMLPPEHTTDRSSIEQCSASAQQDGTTEAEADSNNARRSRSGVMLSSSELQQTMLGQRHSSGAETTLRSDIRNEWVDAVFGKDFFPESKLNAARASGVHGRTINVAIQQTLGAAGIHHTVTYGAIIDSNGHASSRNDEERRNGQSGANLSDVFATPSKTLASQNASTPLMNVDADNSLIAGSLVTPLPGQSHQSQLGGGQFSQHGKLGLTISRIPLGLYVHSIATSSEAYTVGISPGSILVKINGLGMLGERSDRAMERVWRYAGVDTKRSVVGPGNDRDTEMIGGGGNTLSKSASNLSQADEATIESLKVHRPVHLTLYKSGRLYDVVLLSGNALGGINWSSCGNFGLIHKVPEGSKAALCGVRRGTLLIALGGSDPVGDSSSGGADGTVQSCRTLDHAGVASQIKELHSSGQSIALLMGYTPAASRSGFLEKSHVKKVGSGTKLSSLGSEKKPSTSLSTNKSKARPPIPVGRDVEIRSHPVEYTSVLSDALFACTGPSAMQSVDGAETYQHMPASASQPLSDTKSVNIAELASYVAAGGLLPAGGVSAALQSQSLHQRSSSDNLTAGRRYTSDSTPADFTECPILEPDNLLREWDPLVSLCRSMLYATSVSCETQYIEAGGPYERLVDLEGEAPFDPLECIHVIEGIAKGRYIADITVQQPVGTLADLLPEEVFDSHLLQLLGCAITPGRLGDVVDGQRLNERLMDVVIDLALNDINLCQNVFFLLRAFIGELEEQKLPHGYIHEHSALAVRLCRYAQRRLSSRMFDKSAGCLEEEGKRLLGSEAYAMSRESSSSTNDKMYQMHNFHELTMNNTESFGDGEGRLSSNGYPTQSLTCGDGVPVSLGSTDGEQSIATDYQPSVACPTPSQSPGSSHENHASNTKGDIYANTKGDIYEQLVPTEPSRKKKSKSKAILKLLKPSKGFKRNSSSTGDNPSTAKPVQTGSGKQSSPGKISTKRFPNVFSKTAPNQVLQTINGSTIPTLDNDTHSHTQHPPNSITLSRKFDNMAWILRRLDQGCQTIEKNLMKSFRQKIAEWALYPWSASKEKALRSVTDSFRSELQTMNGSDSNGTGRFPILNPVDTSELLVSVDSEECFILPSAHFPLLLCFNSEQNIGSPRAISKAHRGQQNGADIMYRVKVEIMGLSCSEDRYLGDIFAVQGAVGGTVQVSGLSEGPRKTNRSGAIAHLWGQDNALVFETRSNWGSHNTLSLNLLSVSRSVDVVEVSDEIEGHGQARIGCFFVDLSSLWRSPASENPTSITVSMHSFGTFNEFDQHGDANIYTDEPGSGSLELHLCIRTEIISLQHSKKRLLLYKHGDDLRQELLAIQFIERCNQILVSSGLDLKIKTFSCQPVGSKTGFIEWVRGTIPLSELCKSSSDSSNLESNLDLSRQESRNENTPAELESLQRTGQSKVPQSHHWCKHQSLPGLRQAFNGTIIDNPIQDFLRSAAYNEGDPYFIKKNVMSNYVKSCAGYSVITYILGVGDRHLDNILLHQNGYLLHCDYSFILGQDPKTYLPMRITEEMVKGFGGKDSDNFAKFLGYVGAAFLTLRRPNNLHALLSLMRIMVHTNMSDLSIKQSPLEAILSMRGRFRLDLSNDEALAYIEQVVEKSITSKIWRAVDVMHNLGKHF